MVIGYCAERALSLSLSLSRQLVAMRVRVQSEEMNETSFQRSFVLSFFFPLHLPLSLLTRSNSSDDLDCHAADCRPLVVVRGGGGLAPACLLHSFPIVV